MFVRAVRSVDGGANSGDISEIHTVSSAGNLTSGRVSCNSGGAYSRGADPAFRDCVGEGGKSAEVRGTLELIKLLVLTSVSLCTIVGGLFGIKICYK